jgi:O-antigen/teichoic acid export membrane protein
MDAGLYAAASLLGKIVMFVTAPIAMVMFPKATVMHNKNNNGIALLRKSLLYTGSISLLIIAVFIIAPESIVRILFGSKFQSVNDLIVYFAIALAFLSLTNAIVFYDLATRKYRFLYILVIISLLEVVLISLFHDNILMVVRILTALMVILFMCVWFCEKR